MQIQGALIALTVLIAFIIIFSTGEEEQLFLEAKEIINEGESLKIKIESNAEFVTLTFGEEIKTFECNTCTIEKEFFPGAGIYNLQVTTKTKSESKKITVQQSKKTCLNNIPLGECAEKSLYCDNGVLVENCEKCGCKDGYYCEGECVPIAGEIELNVTNPKIIPTRKEFPIKITLSGNEGAKYKIKINSPIKEEKTIALNGKTTIDIFSVLEKGTYDINIQIFAINKETALIREYFEEKAIDVMDEIPEPLVPVFESVFVEGDDVVMQWQDNNAYKYNLYWSNNANPAFISYKYHSTYFETQAVIQALGKGTHFFILTSEDAFGNESDYSEVQTITIQ